MVERFFLVLKVKSIHGWPLMHSNPWRGALFETIEVESHRILCDSALGYIVPDAFETG